MSNTTTLRHAPTVHVDESFNPFVTDDFGALVRSDWAQLSLYLNDQFKSIPAALEYLGGEPEPMPALV